MKIASGAFSARRRGTRWPSVSVGAALQLAGREVEQAHEVVDHAVQLGVGDQAAEARADLELRRCAPTCLSAAIAIAASQTFDHGSGEAAKNAIDSRPKILSPIGLSSRLPLGRQAAWPSRW